MVVDGLDKLDSGDNIVALENAQAVDVHGGLNVGTGQADVIGRNHGFSTEQVILCLPDRVMLRVIRSRHIRPQSEQTPI